MKRLNIFFRVHLNFFREIFVEGDYVFIVEQDEGIFFVLTVVGP